MLYVFGIVDADNIEPLIGDGYYGVDVSFIKFSSFSAAVCELRCIRIDPTPKNVWHHEQVLKKLMLHYAVLPLRFNTLCIGTDALKHRLQMLEEKLVGDLMHLRGKVEIALHVETVLRNIDIDVVSTSNGRTSSVDNSRSPGKGFLYVQSRLDFLREKVRSETDAERLHALLLSYLRDTEVEAICYAQQDKKNSLIASCLVEQVHISDFFEIIERIRKEQAHLQITYTGPWAPYSFVTVRHCSEECPS
jgi:hypothetical protein